MCDGHARVLKKALSFESPPSSCEPRAYGTVASGPKNTSPSHRFAMGPSHRPLPRGLPLVARMALWAAGASRWPDGAGTDGVCCRAGWRSPGARRWPASPLIATAVPSCLAAGVLAFAPLGPDYVAAGVAAGLCCAIFAAPAAALASGTPWLIPTPRSSTAVIQASLLAAMWHNPTLADPNLCLAALALCVLLAGLMRDHVRPGRRRTDRQVHAASGAGRIPERRRAAADACRSSSTSFRSGPGSASSSRSPSSSSGARRR